MLSEKLAKNYVEHVFSAQSGVDKKNLDIDFSMGADERKHLHVCVSDNIVVKSFKQDSLLEASNSIYRRLSEGFNETEHVEKLFELEKENAELLSMVQSKTKEINELKPFYDHYKIQMQLNHGKDALFHYPEVKAGAVHGSVFMGAE